LATPALKNAHLSQLLENVAEVQQILAIHTKVAGEGRGRKYDVEVLNKSAVVLIVACWEAFVEDLAEGALRSLVELAPDHSVFPAGVLERVASKHSGVNAWKLAGNGWKDALRSNLKEVLAKTTGTLNTPRAPQVDELFQKTIGLDQLSACWKWNRRTSAQSIKALDELVTLRGSIAHRVKHSQPVLKRDVTGAVELISRLAAKSSNRVREFVHTQSGSHPWTLVRYKGMA
jgi:RiboL-PSP-HEPN